MIYLDTSFLIGMLTSMSREDVRLKQWMRERRPVATSAVSWAEFLCGPLKPDQLVTLEGILGEPVPFARLEAEKAADLFNATGRRRGAFVDCMIAAAALVAGATVATSNVDDFVRFRPLGLKLEQV